MKTQKITFIVMALIMSLTMHVSAKQIYVRLNNDSQAWNNVSEDENNQIVTLSSGNTDFSSSEIWGLVEEGDIIWVAKGEYNNTANISLKTDEELGINYGKVKIYGGFKGDETSIDDRTFVDEDNNGLVEPWEFEYATIMKGSDDGASSFNFFTIYNGSLLNGVTLSDNISTSSETCGARMDDGEISQCIIRDMTAQYPISKPIQGTGIKTAGGLVKHCLIENIHAINTHESGGGAYGGGVLLAGPTAQIKSSVIRGCSVSGFTTKGGGMFINDGALAENCLIYNNESQVNGGGVNVHGSVDDAGNAVTLINLTVVNNWAGNSGAGIMVDRFNYNEYNCVVWQNKSTGDIVKNARYVRGPVNGKGIWVDGFAWDGGMTSPENNTNIENMVGVELNALNDFNIPGLQFARFMKPTSFAGIPFDNNQAKEMREAQWVLMNNSHLIGAGVNTATNPNDETIFDDVDIIGNARLANSANFTIGAYEYIENSTSINEFKSTKNKHEVFVSGNSIIIENADSNAFVELFDVFGRKVEAAQLKGRSAFTLTESGLYLVLVSEGSSKYTYKVLY